MILSLPVTFTTIGIDIGIDIPILPIYMGNGDDMSDSQYTYTLGPLRLLLSPGFSLGTVLGMDRIPESVPTSQKLVSQTSAEDGEGVGSAKSGHKGLPYPKQLI